MKVFRFVLPLLLWAAQCLAIPVLNAKCTRGDVRAMVVLVQFSDVKFKNTDPKTQFADYLNKDIMNITI